MKFSRKGAIIGGVVGAITGFLSNIWMVSKYHVGIPWINIILVVCIISVVLGTIIPLLKRKELHSQI